MQIHGILMAVAWGLIIPVGVLVSRYGKPWTNWFRAHRAIQVRALVSILAEANTDPCGGGRW